MIAVLALWIVAAVALGWSGVLARSPVPPPAIALLLTVAALLTLRLSARARAAVYALGPSRLVALHLTRIVAGAWFLVLHGRGELPGEFALMAGWGDIMVGAGAAITLAAAIPLRTPARRFGLRAWNALGLLDILLVLGNGVRLFLRDPGLAVPFTTLPLALLPTFIVPAVIVTHLLLFTWSWPRDRR